MEKNYYRHTICFIAAFTFGEGILVLPKQTTLELIIAAAATFLAIILFNKYLNKFKTGKFLHSTVFLLSLISGAVCFFAYVVFVKEKMLVGASPLLIGLLFAAAVIFLFRSKKEAFFKFSLVSFSFVAVLRVVMSILLFESTDFKLALSESLKISGGGILSGFLTFIPSLIAFFYIFCEKENQKAGINGFLLAVWQMAAFAFLSFGVLGEGAYKRAFALTDAASTVNAGRIFTRIDGILYALFFVSAIIKTAGCFKCAENSFIEMKKSFIKS